MKKLLSIILATLALTSAFVFAGCGGGDGYKEVDWDKIQEYIDERLANPYDEDAQIRWKDSYMEISYLYGEPTQTRKVYNKDGISEIFIENTYKDDDKLINSTSQYYVDGYFYEAIGELDDFDDFKIIKTKEAITFDTALWRTYSDSEVFLVEDDLQTWYTYYILNYDIKFYMAKTDSLTKIKVQFNDEYKNTMEYIYDSQYRMVEYYYKSFDNSNVEVNAKEMRPLNERPTFPELTDYELVSY